MRKIASILPFFLFISIHAYLQRQAPLFTQLTPKQTNIDFKNEISETEDLNVLAYEYFYNGGGVAIGDINNDGLADIFFTGNARSNRLYLNKTKFVFDDITRRANVGGRKDWKTGVNMADVNGDGWLDIYVCYSGKGNEDSRRNELYINNRNLTFTEKAKEYGLDDPGCSTQAVFFDYDIDGDLDCYILNHNIKAYKNVELQYLKQDYDPLAADRLYRNDKGKFTDVSKEAGISGNPISFGLGVAVSDINNDGWSDLYVCNDYTEQDYCYINNANGSFTQKELYMFGHLSQFSMGVDIADINNDGLVDIFTLDMLPEDNRRQKLLQGQENYELYLEMAQNGFHYQFMRNMLQLNNGNGTFSEIGQLAGVSNTDWSWAPLFADFDNDGHKDLFVTNGYMRDYTNKDFLKFWGDYLVKQVANRDSVRYMEIVTKMPSTMVPKYAFRNNGDLTYRDVSEEWGLKQLALSNGAAYGDLDNDGDLDLVVNNINEPAFVFRNEADHLVKNNYLKVQLTGKKGNVYGLGSKIYCYSNGQMQMIEQMPSRGYQSAVSEIVQFGLGQHTKADSVKIIWPDGTVQLQVNIKANTMLQFDQQKAQPVPFTKRMVAKLFEYKQPVFDFTHLQADYNDFKRQPLMPFMFSQCGPRFVNGDFNKDGKEDIFFGSSQGQSGQLFLQENGGFDPKRSEDLTVDNVAATSDLVAFDADNDGDLDVYAASGGYHDYDSNDVRLQDRLFLNDGDGKFTKAGDALPTMLSAKSAVAFADIDNDGDNDLFVGGRVVPGAYPLTPQSYLLLNDGKGHFTDVTEQWMKGLSHLGMITDVALADMNKDKRPDLVLVGEWMAPMILLNEGNRFTIATTGIENYKGWWNTVELADMDDDGDVDMIAGNWGLNSQFRCSETEPVEMYYDDFDGNGSVDPFICCYIQGKSYPYVSRDELLDQMYPMRRKFTSYKSYADATMQDIFPADELKKAGLLKATHLETAWFENRDGKFTAHTLPLQAQYSPVYKIVLYDFNGDKRKDILLLGNTEYTRLKIGKMDANFGTVLLNDGKKGFSWLNNNDAGILIAGDVKDARIVNINEASILLIGINNGNLVNFKLNK
jgi:enediyne biosynthesis protein E4